MSNIKRNDIITTLVNKGFTYEKAGKLFDLTKQSIYAINRDSKSKHPIVCVNCKIEAYGAYNTRHFFFKNDPINICVSCVRMLKNYIKK